MTRAKDVLIGFGAGAVLLTSALCTYFSNKIGQYTGRTEAAIAAKEDLGRRLRTAEEENKRLENHNGRLRDEIVLADVRFKRLYDRLQSSTTSLTTAVRSYKPKTDRTKPDTREPVKPADLDSLIKDMRDVAYSNYENIQQNRKPKLSRQLKSEFISIAKRHGIQATKFEDLQEYFERRGKYFLVCNMLNKKGLFGNVFLTDIVSKKQGSINVNGRDFSFVVINIANFEIDEFGMYDSNGKYATSTLAPGSTVVHNIKVHSASAKTAWYCLSGVHIILDNFKRNILKAEFTDIYNECIRRNASKKEAEKAFIQKSLEGFLEDATINEVYHKSVTGTRFDTNDIEEDVRSVYFNYVHTPLRQAAFWSEACSLFAAKTSYYYKLSEIIFTGFVEYIRAEKRKGRFGNIRIQGNDIKEQVQNLYLLTGAEIKEIAKNLYERRVERFR